MSRSLRFRPRQGGKSTGDAPAVRWQATIEQLACHARGACSRYTSHILVVAVALIVFLFRPIPFQLDYDLPTLAVPTAAPALGFRTTYEPVSGRGGYREETDLSSVGQLPTSAPPVQRTAGLMTASMYQAPVFHTTIPKRLRREVITYTVEPGDNVGKIALAFDLEPETVMWANGSLAQNPDLLRPGQELIILPIDGVYHTVIKGDTLSSIAQKYKGEVQYIIQCPYNQLDPEDPQIVPGDKLIVPGGVKPYVARQVTAYQGPIPEDAKRGTGVFVWPTSGRITDRYGFRTYSGRWHNGLDIANGQGTPIRAADSGFVTFAGWQGNGYGNIVIIDHRNGFVTYYAHLSTYYVTAGQSVGQGAIIAGMGSTGNSTGSHLHFEIWDNGARKNPEMYLP
ncbi:MAG: M23 family metallopeptidase [Anaerolineae bacterium]|nr:M23 family metallopeptidase [Anaerolineae bacterium]